MGDNKAVRTEPFIIKDAWMKAYPEAEFFSDNVDEWAFIKHKNPNEPPLVFEWNRAKNIKNMGSPHRLPLIAAAACFFDKYAIEVADTKHSSYNIDEDKLLLNEERYQIVANSKNEEHLFVAFVERGDNIRLISVRKASDEEVLIYNREKNKLFGIPTLPKGKKYVKFNNTLQKPLFIVYC